MRGESARSVHARQCCCPVHIAALATYHLHPAQDEDEQPLQPELPLATFEEALLEDLPMPKRDMSFSVLLEPH